MLRARGAWTAAAFTVIAGSSFSSIERWTTPDLNASKVARSPQLDCTFAATGRKRYTSAQNGSRRCPHPGCWVFLGLRALRLGHVYFGPFHSSQSRHGSDAASLQTLWLLSQTDERRRQLSVPKHPCTDPCIAWLVLVWSGVLNAPYCKMIIYPESSPRGMVMDIFGMKSSC